MARISVPRVRKTFEASKTILDKPSLQSDFAN